MRFINDILFHCLSVSGKTVHTVSSHSTLRTHTVIKLVRKRIKHLTSNTRRVNA